MSNLGGYGTNPDKYELEQAREIRQQNEEDRFERFHDPVTNKSEHMPSGYYLLRTEGDDLIVGIGTEHFGKWCRHVIRHDDNDYKAGSIEALPMEYASQFCSIRRYVPRTT